MNANKYAAKWKGDRMPSRIEWAILILSLSLLMDVFVVVLGWWPTVRKAAGTEEQTGQCMELQFHIANNSKLSSHFYLNLNSIIDVKSISLRVPSHILLRPSPHPKSYAVARRRHTHLVIRICQF